MVRSRADLCAGLAQELQAVTQTAQEVGDRTRGRSDGDYHRRPTHKRGMRRNPCPLCCAAPFSGCKQSYLCPSNGPPARPVRTHFLPTRAAGGTVSVAWVPEAACCPPPSSA
jgi:hypothetical protein